MPVARQILSSLAEQSHVREHAWIGQMLHQKGDAATAEALERVRS